MKKIFVSMLLTLVLLVGAISVTGAPDNPPFTASGTVIWEEDEGGYYLIQSDSGALYEPVSWDDEFKMIGLRVEFTATRSDLPPTWGHIKGMLIVLDSISVLQVEIGGGGTLHWYSYCTLDCTFPCFTPDGGDRFYVINGVDCGFDAFTFGDNSFSDGDRVSVTGSVDEDIVCVGGGETYNLLTLITIEKIEEEADDPLSELPGFELLTLIISIGVCFLLLKWRNKK